LKKFKTKKATKEDQEEIIMNISAIWKLKGAWEKFTTNHPKFPLFLDAMQRKGIQEGTVIAISFTDVEGKTIETNIKVTASDIELYESLKDLR
jgi:hypothetical protein